MARYIPDTIDLKKIIEKFKSENNYNDYQIKYKNCIEEIVNAYVDFASVNEIINSCGIKLKTIGDYDYNIYHKHSLLECEYLFIRNNMHVENLSDKELDILKSNSINEDFIKKTLDKVIHEDEKFLAYGDDPNNLKFTGGLIFEFAYDSTELSNDDRAKVADYIKQVFVKINEGMKELSIVSNYTIYDKDPDYFRPVVKNRSSLLNKMKVVKTVNDFTVNNKEEFKESLPTIEYKKENNIPKEDLELLKNLEESLTDEVIKEQVEEKEEEISDEIRDLAPSKEEKEENLLFDNKIGKKYIGTIENKKYIVRFIDSFYSRTIGRLLYLYDYSINGNHSIYYTDINIDDLVKAKQTDKIDVLFSISNQRRSKGLFTSYIGSINEHDNVYEDNIESTCYDSKVVTRENGNLVIIDNGNVIANQKRLYSYYVLNLSNDEVTKITTETDVFSNINSNEELSNWLTDENLEKSKKNSSYAGNLLPDGKVI